VRINLGKEGKDRVVPMGAHAVVWLRKYIVSARPALLGPGRIEADGLFLSWRGRPLNPDEISAAVERWRVALGMDKPVGPQALRRSCATELIRDGANSAHVKDILGHEDFSSLAAHVKLAVVDLKEALNRFHPREQGPSRGKAIGETA
jgi:integrase/recombinase XerD